MDSTATDVLREDESTGRRLLPNDGAVIQCFERAFAIGLRFTVHEDLHTSYLRGSDSRIRCCEVGVLALLGIGRLFLHQRPRKVDIARVSN
jgi:hypothetical protein